MKQTIHPKYQPIAVECACGAKHETLSTKQFSKIEICSQCHPFYTGKQKLLDTEGRIEKFRKKFGSNYGASNSKK